MYNKCVCVCVFVKIFNNAQVVNYRTKAKIMF